MSDPRHIDISAYDYDLPAERIARYPLADRAGSKLLCWNKGHITDAAFVQLPGLLPSGSVLVFNDSKVIRARFIFKNSAAQRIEVFCLEPEGEVSESMQCRGEVSWRCLVGGLRKFRDQKLVLTHGDLELSVTLVENRSDHVVVKFFWHPQHLTFSEVLELAGALPIPPYLEREAEKVDDVRYQTVYAEHPGSVAAPTAGLHFTPELIKELGEKGVSSLRLQLHVGSGTFRPVKAETLGRHDMHGEWITVSRDLIEGLVNGGKKIIAVGTTSLRALESLYWLALRLESGNAAPLEVHQWDPYSGVNEQPSPQVLKLLLHKMEAEGREQLTFRSSLLIAPPYRLRVAAGLITNFHQPRSTLLLLVASVVGKEWKRLYDHALMNGYRFLSYGDSSLLLP